MMVPNCQQLPESQHVLEGFLDIATHIHHMHQRLIVEGVHGEHVLLWSLCFVFLWSLVKGIEVLPFRRTDAQAINIWQTAYQQTALVVLVSKSAMPRLQILGNFAPGRSCEPLAKLTIARMQVWASASAAIEEQLPFATAFGSHIVTDSRTQEDALLIEFPIHTPAVRDGEA